MSPFNLQSPAWRIQNLCAIKDSDSVLSRFTPNAAQRHYYNHRHVCNHILKARKLGFSTYNMMEAFDLLMFKPGSEVGIIDYSLPDAKKKLAMIKLCYENLDNALLHPPEIAALGAQLKKQTIMRGSPMEIRFTSGNHVSLAYCGTSLRGSTPTALYISELGKTAIFAPGKADEIRSGALNSITPGNRITIESTHEGGRNGMHYDLLQTAIGNDPDDLSAVDFKFHFFPWWLDERYQLPARPLRPDIFEYFLKLEPARIEFCKQHGFAYHPLTDRQMTWYDAKEKSQKHGMKKEFPSLPGEAFDAPAEGAIYAREMYDLRSSNRLRDFLPSPTRPLVTSWDLGMSDATAIWLIQLDGPDFLWLDWYESSGMPIRHYVDKIHEWQTKYSRRIHTHYLPHDSVNRSLATGKTYIAQLAEHGINNITVVPRTADIWHGINHLRDILPRSYFHETNTATERTLDDGSKAPSGVACLEGYHKRVSKDGIVIENSPVHDRFSHSADAARTFADADRLKLLPSRASEILTPQKIRIVKPTF